MSMDEKEIRDFLEQPMLARLATVNEDGSPQVTPVWTYYDGELFYFTTVKSRVKAQNILRDNRVAFTIDTPTPPYKAVVVQGRATWRSDLSDEIARKLSIRYLGEEKGREYAEELLSHEGRTAFVVKPERFVTWDGSK